MLSQFFPLSAKEAKEAGISFPSEINRNAEFPTRLRKLRENPYISQQKLANEIGVTKSTIGLYENGDNVPDVKTLYKLAKYYNVSADYLLGLTDDPERKPSAVDELGLSPRAVSILCYSKSYFDKREISHKGRPEIGFTAARISNLVSAIIEDPRSTTAIDELFRALQESKKCALCINEAGLKTLDICTTDKSKQTDANFDAQAQQALDLISDKGLTLFSTARAASFYADYAKKLLSDIMNSYVDDFIEISVKEVIDLREVKNSAET